MFAVQYGVGLLLSCARGVCRWLLSGFVLFTISFVVVFGSVAACVWEDECRAVGVRREVSLG